MTARLFRRRPPVEQMLNLLHEPLQRHGVRQRLMTYRRLRTVALGPCMRVQFEDAITVRWQVHEVLRVERRQGPEAQAEEMALYRHLLPTGGDLRATLFIELPEAGQRRRELPLLNEAVHQLHLDVAPESSNGQRVHAEANEDQPDRHRDRPSAVHFLRFALPLPLRQALLSGGGATLGCSHPQYTWRHVLKPATLKLLRRDLHGRAPSTPALTPAPTAGSTEDPDPSALPAFQAAVLAS